MIMDYRNRDDIWQLVCEYTESEQLRKHMLAVEAAMKFYALKYGADEILWGNIGLVHDFDYDKYPDQHPFFGLRLLTELNFPEEFLYAIRSHADYGDPNATDATTRE